MQGWFHRNDPTEKSSATIYRPAWGLHLFVPRLLESQRFRVAMGGSQWNTIISHRWCGSPCWRLVGIQSEPTRSCWKSGGFWKTEKWRKRTRQWNIDPLGWCISCFEFGIFHCHGRLPEGSVSGKLEYFQHPSYSVDYTCFNQSASWVNFFPISHDWKPSKKVYSFRIDLIFNSFIAWWSMKSFFNLTIFIASKSLKWYIDSPTKKGISFFVRTYEIEWFDEKSLRNFVSSTWP